jgi:signal transduction protein with GAF and PtsI domain
VGLALGTTLDLDQLLELILLSKITEALEAERATLYLLDEAKDELVSRIAAGRRGPIDPLKVGQGIAGHVARTGKAAPREGRLQGSALQPRVGRPLGLPDASRSSRRR